MLSKFRSFFLLRQFVENWYEVLLLKYGLRDNIVLRLRHPALRLRINREEYAIPFYLSKILAEGSLDVSNSLLSFRGLKFKLYNLKSDIPCIYTTFIKREYTKFDFKNKVVLDIGAYIGDTTILFAVEGARKVLAYEPNPEVFSILLENVMLNNLQNVIVPHNVAIGREGFSEFFISSFAPSSTSYIERAKVLTHTRNEQIVKKVSVKSYSISRVLEEIGGCVDILKMDCEGCEFLVLNEIVKKSLDDKIREGIILEIHYFDKGITLSKTVELIRKASFKKIYIEKVLKTTSLVYAYK